MNRYFRQIKGFNGYYITKRGILYSKNSNKHIKHNKNVILIRDGKRYLRSVKKLIEETFEIIDVGNNDNFKRILGFENYKIDIFGNIYSTYSRKFKNCFINNGYKCVFLSKNSKLYMRSVNKLISETWNIKI